DRAVHRVVPGDLSRREAEADGAFLHVRLALGEQLVGDFLMTRDARALEHRRLVPVEAEPREPVEDHAGVFVGGALLVGVLDAEQEHPAHVARVQPVEERGAGTTHVQVARGRRGEADARGHRGRGNWGSGQGSPLESSKARRGRSRESVAVLYGCGKRLLSSHFRGQVLQCRNTRSTTQAQMPNGMQSAPPYGSATAASAAPRNATYDGSLCEAR